MDTASPRAAAARHTAAFFDVLFGWCGRILTTVWLRGRKLLNAASDTP